MRLAKILDILSLIATWATKGIGWIGVSALTAMMLLTGSDVTLRYALNKPIAGSMELTEVLMTLVVGLGFAWTALNKGHVRVDVLITRLSTRAQIVADIVAYLVFFGLYVMITWRTLLRAQSMTSQHLMTQVLFIPVPPFALMVTVGFAVLCLVVLRDFVDSLYRMVKK